MSFPRPEECHFVPRSLSNISPNYLVDPIKASIKLTLLLGTLTDNSKMKELNHYSNKFTKMPRAQTEKPLPHSGTVP